MARARKESEVKRISELLEQNRGLSDRLVEAYSEMEAMIGYIRRLEAGLGIETSDSERRYDRDLVISNKELAMRGPDTLYENYRGYEIYLVVGARGRLYTVSVPADGEVWRVESSAALRCHINYLLDGPPVPRS